MAGRYNFDIAGSADAAIINEGKITAGEAGLVGLVAPYVVNSGVISAKLGKVQLASGSTFALDMYGDGLVNIAVDDAVKNQLVANTGRIEALGGEILMTAAAGRNVVDSLVYVSGELHAPAVMEKDGKIIIAGADEVLVDNAIINASGRTQGERGGIIEILGDRIALIGNTILDATGFGSADEVELSEESATMTADKRVKTEEEFLADNRRAGGSIKVGGDYLGSGDTQTASELYVGANVLTLNDALQNGDAGRTIFWSDVTTKFQGLVLARGGETSGNGGFLETSSKGFLDATGYADLTTAAGFKGTYLLDPSDITIYGNVDAQFASTDGSVNLAEDNVLWFDASDNSTLSLSGTRVNRINDKSGAGNNTGSRGGLPRISENAINGLDAVSFGNNTRLEVSDTGDINVGDRGELSRAFVFRTDSEVNTRQMIFKEGGGTNGYVAYVDSGNLYVGIYNDHGTVRAWRSYGVDADTTYNISSSFDAAANDFTVSLNGSVMSGAALGVGQDLKIHTGDIVFGASDSGLRNTTGSLFNENDTVSTFAEAVFHDRALTQNEMNLSEQYAAAKWGIELNGPGTGATEAAKAMAADGYSVFAASYLERLSDSADIVLLADNTITLDLQGDSLDLANDRSITLTTLNGDIGTASMGSIVTNRIGSGGNIAFTSGGAGDINFDHNFTLNAQNGGQITLDAGGAVNLNNNLRINNGDLLMRANSVNGSLNGVGSAAGSFVFEQKNLADTLAIGNSPVHAGAATITLSDALVSSIKNNFDEYTFGHGNGGDVKNNTTSWDDSVMFRTGGDFINTTNISSTGSILALAVNDIILDGAISTTSSAADAIVLSAGRDFVNNSGAGAMSAVNSRWLIYSSTQTGNTRGELLPDASDFGKSYASDAPASIGAGNRFVYATTTRQTLSFDVNDDVVGYGDDYLATPGITYLSGLLAGDSLANIAEAGAVNFATSYAAGDTSGAGALGATQGTLTNALGYLYSFNAGDLSVDGVPAPVAPGFGSGFGLADEFMPSTVEQVSQNSVSVSVFNKMDDTIEFALNNRRPKNNSETFNFARRKKDADDQTYTGFENVSGDGQEFDKIVSSLISIHPSLAKYFGIAPIVDL